MYTCNQISAHYSVYTAHGSTIILPACTGDKVIGFIIVGHKNYQIKNWLRYALIQLAWHTNSVVLFAIVATPIDHALNANFCSFAQLD